MAVTKEQIEADIKKFVLTYCQTGAETAAEEFTKSAEKAIQDFYADYSPKKYFRTDDIRDNSYRKSLRQTGKHYYGGVRVSSENMEPYTYGPSSGYKFGTGNPSSIAEGVWRGGYRGPKAPSSDSPLTALKDMTLRNKAVINSILNKARSAAVNQSYTAIKPHLG